MRKLLIITALAALLCCCGKKEPAPEPVHVADVYRTVADYGRVDSLERPALLEADTAELRAFMSVVSELPVTDRSLQGWSWSLEVMMFTPMVDSVFTHGTDSIALAIGSIRSRLREAGVDLAPRRYAAVVWGRHESVLFVDSVMLIALNHYLGAENDAYRHFPLYMRLVKEPRLMPYDLAEALVATDHPYANGDEGTALQRMLYEGALTAAKMEAVKDATPADALGYRPEQMRFIVDEESNLWRTMLAEGLLFDTSVATIDRLVRPAPNTGILDPRCPGRVGRYFGYRIVENYRRRHPEASLSFLLSPQFYNDPQVLAESRYNP